jgi:RHS repeat-associated protein
VQPSDAASSTLSYDNAGNMTTDGRGRTFTYDAWNRPVKVNGTVRYSYDALGRRIKEGSTELYYSKDWQVLEERNSSNAPVARNVWSPVYVDALVLRDRDADGNGSLEERLYGLQDANYNMTALVSTAGSVVERYLYDPYGRFDVKDASWGTRAGSSYAWVYLHQGGRWDGTSGLYAFRRRDESPNLMRWTTVDPIGFVDGINLFSYVGNRPVVRLDPNGTKTCTLVQTPKMVFGPTRTNTATAGGIDVGLSPNPAPIGVNTTNTVLCTRFCLVNTWEVW